MSKESINNLSPTYCEDCGIAKLTVKEVEENGIRCNACQIIENQRKMMSEYKCPDCDTVFDAGRMKHANDIATIKVYGVCRQCYVDHIDARYPAHPDNKVSV